jgi:hypothetical protein
VSARELCSLRASAYERRIKREAKFGVRFVISDIKPESCKFEQSFSTDGGKTWEVNWIAIDTRVKE